MHIPTKRARVTATWRLLRHGFRCRAHSLCLAQDRFESSSFLVRANDRKGFTVLFYSVSASGTLASPGSRRCTNPNEPAPAGEHHAAVQDRTAEIAGGHRAAVQDRTAEMSDESNGLPGLSLDEEWMPDPSGTGWLSRRGDLWSGDVVAGLPFGDGAMTFADSQVLVNGRIVMQSLRTDHRSFKGQCSVKWPTGSSFAGMVSGSFFEGQGTFRGANGDRYTGEWIHSRRHGRGTLWSTDAVQLDLPASSSRAKMMRYEGEWVENMMHGNGVIEYFGDIDDEIVENPVVRRFVGRFFKGFPTEGSLQNTREIFDNVCFDGATHAGDFAVWYWAGDSSGDAHMSPQNPNTLMHLSESGEEYRMAEAQLRKSLSASDLPIQSIQRVQNDELRICYDMQRRSLIKKVEARSKDLARSSWDPHTMERWAFHAPGRDMSVPEPWECIVTEGFQATLAGSQNGRAFGAGIYFAKDASMANGYAKRACSRMTAGTFRRQNHTPSPANTSAGGVRIEKDSNREDSNRELTCRMFLSRIVTGVFTNGNSRMNQPPIDPDGATGEHFHSLVDNVMEPRIFVINDNTRAYPGYLITYKLQGRLEIDEGASVLARPNKYFKLQHGGLSQAHSTALPRGLNREAAEFEREKACPTYHNATDNQGVMAKPINDEMTKWKGTISGPKGTPYEGGVFVIDIDLSDGYPFKPPKMKFETKVWHPNVSWRTGAICLDILRDQWSPALTLLKVLITLQSVLAGPEVDLSCWTSGRGFSDADAVVAQEYKTDVEKWRQKAKSWTEQYAKPSWYHLNLPG